MFPISVFLLISEPSSKGVSLQVLFHSLAQTSSSKYWCSTLSLIHSWHEWPAILPGHREGENICLYGILMGPPPWLQTLCFVHGLHHIMVYTSTGDDSHAKDDVPHFPLVNPLPLPAKVNDWVHFSIHLLWAFFSCGGVLVDDNIWPYLLHMWAVAIAACK